MAEHHDDFDFDHHHDKDDAHRHDGDLPATLLDATVDDTATDGSGHILSGSGNPADGWEIQNYNSFQLASDVHYRQGDTVQPVAVDDDGLLIYSMPAGPRS